jgi:hypothetical protein
LFVLFSLLFHGNSNHTRLGPQSRSLTSQTIFALDDLGFDANQSSALTDGLVLTGTISFFVNTFLLGATLRATDSRFKEPTGGHRFPFKVSLLSLGGLLNNTNNSHGDHCIFAMTNDPTRPPNDTGNQVLDDSRCRPFFEPVSTAVVGFPVVAQL